MSNNSGTMYVGVTNNLFRRVFEHKNKVVDGFTKKYNIDRLIYFEQFQDINQAIIREKQIKSWRREKKINLVKFKNPKFENLAKDWFDQEKTLLQ
jgi:putative endonuclease